MKKRIKNLQCPSVYLPGELYFVCIYVVSMVNQVPQGEVYIYIPAELYLVCIYVVSLVNQVPQGEVYIYIYLQSSTSSVFMLYPWLTRSPRGRYIYIPAELYLVCIYAVSLVNHVPQGEVYIYIFTCRALPRLYLCCIPAPQGRPVYYAPSMLPSTIITTIQNYILYI